MTYQLVAGDIVKDKERLLAFWRANGRAPLDEKYAWIYERNQDGEVQFWLLLHEASGDVVGAATLFPRNFTVSGDSYRGGVAGDFLISPQHRSLGPAVMLQRAVTAAVKARGLEFIIIYPNQNASLVAKRVGYKGVGYLARLVKPLSSSPVFDVFNVPEIVRTVARPILDLGFLLSMYGPFFGARDYNFRSVATVGREFDELWEEYKAQLRFSAQRSSDYLNWKYGEDPDDVNKFFIAENKRTGKMEACLVYRRNARVAEIRDLFPGADTKVARMLIRKFSLRVNKLGINRLVACTLSNSDCAKTYLSAGFREGQSGRVVMVLEAGKEVNIIDMLKDGSGVMLMMSDEDT